MIDEKVRDDVARALALVEGINLDWITDQSNPRWAKYRQLASAALEAYEAAKPVAPMSTSGEMVERLRRAMRSSAATWETAPVAKTLLHEAASRLEALEALVAEKEGAAGWIVTNAEGDRFRTWDQFPIWTEDRNLATRYVRREDAERAHAEDEDAWKIIPYSAPAS